MAWNIELSVKAAKQFSKLDRQSKIRVQKKLENILNLNDPRSHGKALTGNYKGLWRYRVGEYRIVCDLIDEKSTILVIKIAHRSSVYN